LPKGSKSRPRRSRSRGCWPESPGSSRSRARPSVTASRKTSAPPQFSSRPTISRRSTAPRRKSPCKARVTRRRCSGWSAADSGSPIDPAIRRSPAWGPRWPRARALVVDPEHVEAYVLEQHLDRLTFRFRRGSSIPDCVSPGSR
jgi:hypothetical protein